MVVRAMAMAMAGARGVVDGRGRREEEKKTAAVCGAVEQCGAVEPEISLPLGVRRGARGLCVKHPFSGDTD